MDNWTTLTMTFAIYNFVLNEVIRPKLNHIPAELKSSQNLFMIVRRKWDLWLNVEVLILIFHILLTCFGIYLILLNFKLQLM